MIRCSSRILRAVQGWHKTVLNYPTTFPFSPVGLPAEKVAFPPQSKTLLIFPFSIACGEHFCPSEVRENPKVSPSTYPPALGASGAPNRAPRQGLSLALLVLIQSEESPPGATARPSARAGSWPRWKCPWPPR